MVIHNHISQPETAKLITKHIKEICMCDALLSRTRSLFLPSNIIYDINLGMFPKVCLIYFSQHMSLAMDTAISFTSCPLQPLNERN